MKISNRKFLINYMNTPKSFLAAVCILISSFIISSCGSKNAPENEEAKNEPASTGELTTVSITSEQSKAIDIELGTIEQKNLSSVLRVTGTLEVPPQNKANVSALIGGTVQDIKVLEGNTVKKGQVLLTIANPSFVQLQQDYLDAVAQLSFAEADYKRQQELAEKNVAAQKTFQQATAEYNSLQAKLNGIKAQLHLLNIDISQLTPQTIQEVINVKSPINGSVSHIDVNVGSSVDATSTLLDVVDNTHLHADVFVYEQDLPKVKENQIIDFTLTNLPGRHYEAKVFSVGSAFESESKSIAVHAEIIGNTQGLIAGMNITAFINVGENLTPAVLTSAIINHSGNDYIFITAHHHPPAQHEAEEKESDTRKEQNGDAMAFERIQVKRGVTSGGFTQITPLEETPQDVKVVTNGAFYLMAILTNSGEEE